MEEAKARGRRRTPGRPPIVDKQTIVAAARGLDPQTLTMQGLADELGIQRKTLHYHVKDRHELLRLAAVDTLKAHLSGEPFRRYDDWRSAVRAFASQTRRSVIAAGPWVTYLPFEGRMDLMNIGPAESALKAMVAAGFDIAIAARALGLAAEFSLTSARDAIYREAHGKHPHLIALREVLDDVPAGDFEVLKQLDGAQWDEFGTEQQFEFDLRVLIHGLEPMQNHPGTSIAERLG